MLVTNQKCSVTHSTDGSTRSIVDLNGNWIMDVNFYVGKQENAQAQVSIENLLVNRVEERRKNIRRQK